MNVLSRIWLAIVNKPLPTDRVLPEAADFYLRTPSESGVEISQEKRIEAFEEHTAQVRAMLSGLIQVAKSKNIAPHVVAHEMILQGAVIAQACHKGDGEASKAITNTIKSASALFEVTQRNSTQFHEAHKVVQ